MDIVNINKSKFTLIRSTAEKTLMSTDIGYYDDDYAALYIHFCNNTRIRQVIDIEMIPEFETEILYYFDNSDILMEFYNELQKARLNKFVIDYF